MCEAKRPSSVAWTSSSLEQEAASRQLDTELVSSLSNQDESEYPSSASETETPKESVTKDPVVSLVLDGQSRDVLSLVMDNTMRMSKREMPAYWDLVRRSTSVSFQELRKTANSKIKFNDLYRDPAKHRGGLFSFDIVVRRVNHYEAEPDNPAGVEGVYEIWGTTEQSQSWFYVFITGSLPAGYSEETLVRKKAQFAGYFLKLLAYQPGSAPPNANPLLAPLLVGRLNDVASTVQGTKSDSSPWPLFGLAGFAVLLATYFSIRILWLGKSQKSERTRPQINPDDFE